MPYLSDEDAAERFVSRIKDLRKQYPDWREPLSKSLSLFNKARSYYGKSPKKHPGIGAFCRQLGCSNSPIQNSHTIAESTLKLLSVDSRVVNPNIRDLRSPKAALVGQGVASTFNGYCDQHEKLFAYTFENSGFSEDFHYTLQAMRSTAREMWKLESYIGYLNLNIEAYEKSISELKLPPVAKRELAKDTSFPLRSMKANAERQLHQMEQMLTWLTSAAEEGHSLPQKVQLLRRKTRYNLALSGSTYFADAKLGSATGLKDVPPFTLVFTVLPEPSGTLFIFATSGHHIDLSLYIEQNFDTPEQISHNLFAWMQHTDHWFANPTWWDALGSRKQSSLLKGLSQT